MKKKSILLGGKLLLASILFFQHFTITAQISAKKVTTSTGKVVAFLQSKPTRHDLTGPNRRYPMIVFLHGGGNDIWSSDTSLLPGAPVWRLTGWGPIREATQHGFLGSVFNNKKDTFIVLQPLSPAHTTWPTTYIDAMIKYGTDSLKADTNRIFLAGHSYGGAGVFNYLNSSSANAKKFAGAVETSAWNTSLNSTGAGYVSAAKLPLWGFHAADDTTTSPSMTINSIATLNAVSPQVKPLLTIWDTGTIVPHPHNKAPDYVFSIYQYPYLEDGVLNIYEWFLGQNNDSLPNVLPVARAGNDTTILSTSGFANLNGSASTDADGKIVRYVWRKISGPTGGTIAKPFDTLSSTTVSGLTTVGEYKFQLNVVDHRASIARDTITINVIDPPVYSGKGVSFTSTSGRINAGNVTELNNASAFTLEAQFKYDSTVSGWETALATIFRKHVTSTDRIMLQVEKATKSVHFTVSNGSSSKGYTASNVVSHDTWCHIAAVFDGAKTGNANRMKIYINGVLQTLTFTDTIPATTSGSAGSCMFGGEPSCCQVSVIDEVRVWDTVLAIGTINSWKNKLLGSCHPNFNDLTVYWPLDNDANPASAVAALGTIYSGGITSGNYVSSTLPLDTIPCPVNLGKAVSFTSATSRINAGNVTEVISAPAFTLEAQFKYDSTSGLVTIFRKYVSANDRIMLHVNSADSSIIFAVANSANTYGYSAANVVSRGTWHHVAAVFDAAQALNANRMKLYIDGVPVALTISGTLPATTSSSSGSFMAGGETYCCQTSVIDEVRVWDTVLPAAIINTYKNKALGTCHDYIDHLAVYWPMNDDSNPIKAAAALGTIYPGGITNGNYVGSNQATAASGCGESAVLSDYTEEITNAQILPGKLYPNPTHGPVQLELNAPASKSITIQVIDMHGRYVYRKQAQVVKGINSLSVNISSLHSGNYLIDVRDGNVTLGRYKVVKR